jgi:hypothetical protein
MAGGTVNLTTPPAALVTINADGTSVTTQPFGYYDDVTTDYFITNNGNATPGTNVLNPQINTGGFIIPGGTGVDGNGLIPDETLGTSPGNGVGDGTGGTPAVTGAPVVPGSLGGSQYRNVINPNLNTLYTSNTLIPSTFSVQEAIDDVVRCNCDCWAIV